MLFRELFGVESFPMRVWAFATMGANLWLLQWLSRRVVGMGAVESGISTVESELAGFAAPFLWIVNSALVSVMYWNSAYNRALCPLFLMGALALLEIPASPRPESSGGGGGNWPFSSADSARSK